VIAEHNGSTGAALADYIYSGSRMIAKAWGLTTKYFLTDRLSVRMTLNSSGNVLVRQAHLPFGEGFGESGAQEKHQFTSYERDSESGTDYAINRQYHLSVGRFNRPDPLGASARMNAPQSWNRYSYVSNIVLDRVDPEGLQDGGPNPCAGMTPGECLCATVPEACYGKRKPIEDGGGVGEGADEPRRVPLFGDRLAQYQNQRARLIRVLKDATSDCSKYLLEKLGLSGSRVARSVRAQRAFDGMLSTISMVTAGLDRSQGMFSDMTVQEFFEQAQPEAKQAEFASAAQGATIFDVYYAPSGLYAGAILHETLHYFLGISDENLAARLGVDISQGSRAISTAFRDAGCR
jgi:RHS repeat-associated protein